MLDLGSGGGIDVLVSARRVGPTGKAYGLHMTPETGSGICELDLPDDDLDEVLEALDGVVTNVFVRARPPTR